MQASSAEGASSDPSSAAGRPFTSRPGNDAADHLQSLCLLARLHHISATPDLLAHELGVSASKEVSDTELLLAAKHIGLKAKLSRTSGERLPLSALPALARMRTDSGHTRWVLLAQAEIKLETFPYTRYGTVPAKVTTITADAVMQEPGRTQPDKDGKSVPAAGGAVFPATLTLAAHDIDVDGKAIRLAPGMNLTAEIKTGKRRVIEYLLSPVQSHVSESLKER